MTCSATPWATPCCARWRAASRRPARAPFFARLGGDEFAVITSPGSQPAAAEALAERLAAALDCDIEINGSILHVGLTIGVGIYPQDGIDAATLVANTDAALFRAKSEMRGSIRFFEISMDKQLREKRALQQEKRPFTVPARA